MPEIVYRRAERGFWNAHVREYYVRKRQIPDAILRLVRNRVVSDIPALADAVDLEAIGRGSKWKRILADFGEASASWYLETRGSIYLVKLRWVDFPLRIMEGIDVLGYRPATKDVAVAEAKVTNSPSLSSTLAQLGDQLSRARIDEELDSPMNEYGSKVWLIEELLNQGVIQEEAVDELLAKTEYVRYGFVFHPQSSASPNYVPLGSRLDAEGPPTTFVDYIMEDLEHEVKSFVEILTVNKELIGNAKPD